MPLASEPIAPHLLVMRESAVGLGALLAMVAGCGPGTQTGRILPAGVVVVGSWQGYPVDGRTAGEIAASMRARAPREGGGGFLGYHHYSMRWTYQTSDLRGACRATTVRVEIETQIRVPEWQRPADADSALVAQWEVFSAALEEHERGHERIAIDGAGQIVQLLRRLQEMTCFSFQNEANREAQRLSDEIAQRQVAFDETTRHGMNAGAVWQPRRTMPGR